MLSNRIFGRALTSAPSFYQAFSASTISRAFVAMAQVTGPVQETIQAKLAEAFNPVHLAVMNESSGHNVPKGSETHFKVVVISEAFQGDSIIARHRKVNKTLREELDAGVHALSIVAKTPEQWQKAGEAVSKSPPCLGGSKN